MELTYIHCTVALVVKNLPADAGDIRDAGSVPSLGRSPGEGQGNPLQYSCLDNPTDRGAWRATVHGVTRVGHDLGLSHHHRAFQGTKAFLCPLFRVCRKRDYVLGLP